MNYAAKLTVEVQLKKIYDRQNSTNTFDKSQN